MSNPSRPFALGSLLALLAQLPAMAQETVKDANGNSYKTVLVGTRKWMAENLRATSYWDNTSVQTSSPATLDVSGTAIPSVYQWAYGGDAANASAYGLLYTFDAALGTPQSMMLKKKLCPVGWSVPPKETWNELVTTLGSGTTAWNKMKESGTTYWNAPNAGTNASGLNIRGAGQKWRDGSFSNLKINTYFWTSTTVSGTEALAWVQTSQQTQDKRMGYSVRCVNDTVFTASGIAPKGEARSWAVTSDPATGDAFLAFPHSASVKLRVHGLDGRSFPVRYVPEGFAFRVPSRGLYLVEIMDGTAAYQRKLLVR